MKRLLLWVPNLSEGRDGAVFDRLVAAARGAGAHLLDGSMDPDHNRAVMTFAGDLEVVEAAALPLARAAVECIDLRRHSGVHRRMGALDVCPFVPLGAASMADAVAVAERVGERIADTLGVPVFLYGRAARCAERIGLGAVRNLGFETLRERVPVDPHLAPDLGPAALHPSAGATAVGARPFLIAFNVDLVGDDLQVAQAVAREVRESGGGLPAVQAMGFRLAEGGCVQVSANLLDFTVTSLRTLFDAVVERSAARGVTVHRSELVGLVPAAALDPATAVHIGLHGFDPLRHTVEGRLGVLGLA